jgi:hypothetical protein
MEVNSEFIKKLKCSRFTDAEKYLMGYFSNVKPYYIPDKYPNIIFYYDNDKHLIYDIVTNNDFKILWINDILFYKLLDVYHIKNVERLVIDIFALYNNININKLMVGASISEPDEKLLIPYNVQ